MIISTYIHSVVMFFYGICPKIKQKNTCFFLIGRQHHNFLYVSRVFGHLKHICFLADIIELRTVVNYKRFLIVSLRPPFNFLYFLSILSCCEIKVIMFKRI